MVNIPDEIQAEIENVEISLSHLKTALVKHPKSVIELSAIAAFLHNIYNGIENILKQIFKRYNLPLSRTDEFWHKKLIQQSVSMHIVSDELSGSLFQLLSFRHFFIHGCGFMLEEKQLMELAKNAHPVWQKFLIEISKYLEKNNIS